MVDELVVGAAVVVVVGRDVVDVEDVDGLVVDVVGFAVVDVVGEVAALATVNDARYTRRSPSLLRTTAITVCLPSLTFVVSSGLTFTAASRVSR